VEPWSFWNFLASVNYFFAYRVLTYATDIDIWHWFFFWHQNSNIFPEHFSKNSFRCQWHFSKISVGLNNNKSAAKIFFDAGCSLAAHICAISKHLHDEFYTNKVPILLIGSVLKSRQLFWKDLNDAWQQMFQIV